jgi:Co/Zn/Cd efflux system component
MNMTKAERTRRIMLAHRKREKREFIFVVTLPLTFFIAGLILGVFAA